MHQVEYTCIQNYFREYFEIFRPEPCLMRAFYVNGDNISKERIREYLLLQEVYS